MKKYKTNKQFKFYILGNARPRMVLLFISAIYPHYYAWWAYVNYYNDDYYKQFWHQLFFTVTELVSTITVFSLVKRDCLVSARKILIIMRQVIFA